MWKRSACFTSVLLSASILSACGGQSTSQPFRSQSITSPGPRSPSLSITSPPPSSPSPRITSPSSAASVSLVLHDGDEVICRSTANGAACQIQGQAWVKPGMTVLLWVQPETPPSQTPGYYIQRVTNGVTQQPQPRTQSPWTGVIQIGSAQYAPCNGDTFDIIATVVRGGEAEIVQSQPQQTYLDPASIQHPYASAAARNVIVSGVSSPCPRAEADSPTQGS